MILDVIDNYSIYSEIKPGTCRRGPSNRRFAGPRFPSGIKKSLEFLSKGRFNEKEPGSYDLDRGIYYMVQEIQTRPEEGAFFEAHRKYIDIQFVISGDELHGYAPLSSLKTQDAYDQEKDVAFYHGTGSVFSLSPGSFAIYFPNDAHKPNLMIDKPVPVKKIVVKVPV